MSWTESELEALRRAYARGQTRVAYDGRIVEYGSAADLLSRIRTIEREIEASAAQTKRPVAGVAAFRRGGW